MTMSYMTMYIDINYMYKLTMIMVNIDMTLTFNMYSRTSDSLYNI